MDTLEPRVPPLFRDQRRVQLQLVEHSVRRGECCSKSKLSWQIRDVSEVVPVHDVHVQHQDEFDPEKKHAQQEEKQRRRREERGHEQHKVVKDVERAQDVVEEVDRQRERRAQHEQNGGLDERAVAQ